MRTISEEEWKEQFSEILIKKMREAGISQKELAERANLDIHTINRYINKRCIPSIPALVNIAHALGCTCHELAMFGAKVI